MADNSDLNPPNVNLNTPKKSSKPQKTNILKNSSFTSNSNLSTQFSTQNSTQNSTPNSPSTFSSIGTQTRRQIIFKNQEIRQFRDSYAQWEKSHKKGLEIILGDLNPKISDFESIENDENRKSARFAQIHGFLEDLKAVFHDLSKIVDSMALLAVGFDCSDAGYVVDSLRDELGNKKLVCDGIFDFSGENGENGENMTANDNLKFFASCWKHQPGLNVAQLKLSLKSLEEKIVKVD